MFTYDVAQPTDQMLLSEILNLDNGEPLDVDAFLRRDLVVVIQDRNELAGRYAGIHYPDTSKYFGDTGIMNASEELKQRGWQIDHQIYMANHFRAAGDMALAWAFGQSKHCNVELFEWFPDDRDLADMVRLLRHALDRLDGLERDRLDLWLESQLRQDGRSALI